VDKNYQVVFVKPKEVVLKEIRVPLPKRGEVLIETVVTQVSTGTELTILNGEFPEGSYWARYAKYPFSAGYSNVGKIIEVGKGVDKKLTGKTVATESPHARYVNCDCKKLNIVPDDIPPEDASFSTIAEIAMNGVRLAKIEPGEKIAVFGLGLLGQLAVQFCKFCGGWPVVGIDPSSFRRKLALKSGAHYSLNPKDKDFTERMKEISKGKMFDVVFEVTGNPKIIPGELEFLRERGRQIILSSPRGPSTLDFHDLVNAPSRVIIGAHNESHPEVSTTYNQWTKARDVEFFFDLLAAGEIKVSHLITHKYKWDKAKDAYEMLLKDRTKSLGVILHWSN
jgi:2-desacetyl-2-hydroxyethyl bacteriochlorophyllide A dehydrogenase